MPVSLRNLISSDIEQIIKLADNSALSDDMCTLPVPFSHADAMNLVDRSNGHEEAVMGIIDNDSNKLSGVNGQRIRWKG